MALVNQTLPFRTRRLGEHHQSRHLALQETEKAKTRDVRGAEPDRPMGPLYSQPRPPCPAWSVVLPWVPRRSGNAPMTLIGDQIQQVSFTCGSGYQETPCLNSNSGGILANGWQC
jgi:hypothetical protein